MPQPDIFTYPERQGLLLLERDRANWAANMAEFGGSKKTADLVQQLRRRGRAARRWSLALLFGLLLTVVAALAVYVIYPLYKSNFDGRLQAAVREKEATEQEIAKVPSEIENIKTELVKEINLLAIPADAGLSAISDFHGSARASKTVTLVFGTSGTLIAYDAETGQARELTGPWSGGSRLLGSAKSSETVTLVFGTSGTLIAYDAKTGQARELTGLWSGESRLDRSANASETVTLVFGFGGTLIAYDAKTGQASALTGSWSVVSRLVSSAKSSETVTLVFGGGGTLIAYDAETGDIISIDLAEMLSRQARSILIGRLDEIDTSTGDVLFEELLSWPTRLKNLSA